MVDAIFWIFVGAFIGWNFPQPFWARWVQDWLVTQWKKITTKTGV